MLDLKQRERERERERERGERVIQQNSECKIQRVKINRNPALPGPATTRQQLLRGSGASDSRMRSGTVCGL